MSTTGYLLPGGGYRWSALSKTTSLRGPKGKIQLRDLFSGRPQLIVYHFMFDPKWTKGCPGCTGFVNSFGDLAMLG